jgi:copper resistance protein D
VTVWDLGTVLVKAVLYAATLGAAGMVFFLSYCDRDLLPGERRTLSRTALMLAAISVTAGAARMLVTAGSMSGDAAGLLDGNLLRMVWHGGEGWAFAIRAGGWLLALPALLAGRRPGVMAIAGAAGAATSFVWSGHAHATGAGWPMLLVDVHLLCAAFWIGALWPLLGLARHGDVRRVAAAAHRFGTLAAWAVSGLIIAGSLVLWKLLGGVSELWDSGYGRIACVKLSLVAALLACAAFNKLRLTPRLLAGDAAAARSLGVSISTELVLAALIVTATAALTTLAGAPALER